MEIKLLGVSRSDTGKGAARKLRAQGRVPAILYGHGMAPVSLSVDARELFHILHTDAGSNVLIDLHVDKEKHLALARDVQRNHVRGDFVHVDFLAISRDEKITVQVPVRIVGESHGVREGGVVEHHLWEIEAECLPGDVPEAIEADITDLGIGESLTVADLPVPSGVLFTSPADENVVSVVTPQVLKVTEEEGVAVEEAAEGEEAAAATEEAAAEGSEAGGDEG
jgi:large subunit ribosomal protein L25